VLQGKQSEINKEVIKTNYFFVMYTSAEPIRGEPTLAVLVMRVIEVMFFIGLAGCALVVVVSWISILTDGISGRDGTQSDSQQQR
jgi:hypothetical protein